MPVTQLVLKDLLLLRLEGLADAQPAAADSATDVADTAFLGKLASNVLVGPALLLEIDDAGVVGIIVGLDRLRAGSLAAEDADVALVGETGAAVRVAGKLVLLCRYGVSCCRDLRAAAGFQVQRMGDGILTPWLVKVLPFASGVLLPLRILEGSIVSLH